MELTQSQRQKLKLEEFPRSAEYDPQWVIDNQMGPNVLWLTEALSQKIEFRPGMRVLDLGCGRAVSSIFLAKEFGVTVWATDLWISASDNWDRISDSGVADRVFPIHAEAHDLPFAESYFDAIVSMDAYHYFGTDDLYIGYISKFAKPGGLIGIVVPGIKEEFNDKPPEHLRVCWEWDFCSFHGPQWWRRHWDKSGKVAVEVSDLVPDGWHHWFTWDGVLEGTEKRWLEMLQEDAGCNLGFTRLVASRR